MEGFRKLHRVGVAFFLLVLVVLGTVSSSAAARPAVGFPGGVRAVETSPARPCHMAASGVGVPKTGAKVAEKYAPMLLNVLPRGRLPPSGPSGGINDVKT